MGISVITHASPVSELFGSGYRCETFEGDTIVQKVLEHFAANSSDAVVITRRSNPVGILTLKDIVRALVNCDTLGLPVHEFMSAPLQTVSPDRTIAEAFEAMQDVPYDKIVVADRNTIIGIADIRHVMAMCYTQLTPMIKNDFPMLHSLMGLVGEGEKELLKMATTDTLTGIGNRRMFEEAFQSFQSLKDRTDHSFYLLLFDVDNFKSINDTFGHGIGDSVLKHLVTLVGGSIRKTDLFVRWGGEEFAILQRYTDPMAVLKVAENIRKKIDEYSFDTIVHVTCSFGLTVIHPEEKLETVFERADKALYRAKSDGKNCVRIEMA